MHNFTILSILLLSFLSIYAFEDDKKMNPILRHFAQHSRSKPLMHPISSSKIEEGGYRNCYLSPIQCHLPVRRDQQQMPINNENVEEDFQRLRRMLFPIN